MARKHRDIYKGRFDEGFDVNKDVDLAHLRELMGVEDIDNASYNYYGIYIRNIIRIMLDSSSFRGYDEDVKESIMAEGTIDALKARLKFDGYKYPARTAPFNYIYRICYHSAQHVLSKYYQMQVRMVPASYCAKDAKLADGSAFDEDILDKAVTDWDQIYEHLAVGG